VIVAAALIKMNSLSGTGPLTKTNMTLWMFQAEQSFKLILNPALIFKLIICFKTKNYFQNYLF
jgi:hypothetical protein